MPLQILQKTFGYKNFRPYQQEIIANILKQKDTIALMPTGGGKSICFQLPAIIKYGLTIVVSPLISLMKDQVDALRQNNVKVDFYNSTRSRIEIDHLKQKLLQNKIKILYVAPERFAAPGFLEFLEKLNISFFAIDEAHCISSWGHDFRPDYRNLSILKQKFPTTTIAAFTATATEKVLQDIINNLNLNQPQIFKASFNRENLFYEVRPKQNALSEIIQFLKTKKDQPSGIIYCLSRKTAEQLAAKLQMYGFKAAEYHAGLDNQTRTKNQEKFLKDEVQIICATIAFGMGIDKPDVRFVFHYNLPKNLESYYQETGRAGRDGLPARCILFFSISDKIMLERFINEMSSVVERRKSLQALKFMTDFANQTVCRRKTILQYFGENFTTDKNFDPQKCCDNCANPIENFDATQLAQKIFSAIFRTNQRFGAGMISDFLVGAKNQKIKNFHLENMQTFGICSEFSAKNLREILAELLSRNFLSTEDSRFPILKLTEKAILVLKNKQKVFLPKTKKPIKSTEKFIAEGNYDAKLFEILRQKRLELARQENVAPYVIFGDKSLYEMAEFLPQKVEDFLKISGVGNAKLEKFGLIFMQEIATFLKKDFPFAEMKKQISARSNLPDIPLPNQRSREILQFLKKGKKLNEIAKLFDIKLSTVFTHLERLILAKELTEITTFISKKKLAILKDFWSANLTSTLSEARSDLKEKFSYDELKLTRALVLSEKF